MVAFRERAQLWEEWFGANDPYPLSWQEFGDPRQAVFVFHNREDQLATFKGIRSDLSTLWLFEVVRESPFGSFTRPLTFLSPAYFHSAGGSAEDLSSAITRLDLVRDLVLGKRAENRIDARWWIEESEESPRLYVITRKLRYSQTETLVMVRTH